MSEQRTEVQIITQEPFKASIGGKLVDIPILKAGKSMAWKKEWSDAIFEFQNIIAKPEDMTGKATDADIMAAGMARLKEMLIGSQEKVLTLVCSYIEKAGGDKEKLLNEACDAEIAALWETICEVMFSPLATSLASAINPKKKK